VIFYFKKLKVTNIVIDNLPMHAFFLYREGLIDDKTDSLKARVSVPLKGHLHEIFDLRFFHLLIHEGPDSRPKAVSHLTSYSPM
jgi:hypothetical protein